MNSLASIFGAAAFGMLAAAPLASAQVPLPGTQPGDIVNWPLRPTNWCMECHGKYDFDRSYEPWDTWAGSMMANSARDPMFWAAVDIANQDKPGIGEWCIRCHAPRAWLEGRSSDPSGAAFVGPPTEPDNDFDGIDCHFCHRLHEGPTGTPYLENAQFWVDDGTPGKEPPRRGPYDDAFGGDADKHVWAYSQYHTSSELCGVCHNVKNPLVNLLDETGADTGLPFPEQTTYDEWAQSRFADDGVECQTCHMRSVEGYACTNIRPFREHVPMHEFSGANAWMTSVLQTLYAVPLEREPQFDSAINVALDQLQNESATVDVSAPLRIEGSGDVTVGVRVTNLTGHKLPTGYPEGRRMWIHVVVQDAFGDPLFESGDYDAATAELVDDPHLRVYETRHGVHGEGEGFHLALNDRIFLDNRIPPEGFEPSTSTAPVGGSYAPLPNGTLPHWDDATYPVTVPGGTVGPVLVTASLYYQTTSKEYVEFLRDENVSGPDPQDPNPGAPSRGEKMHALWDSHDRCPPILMRQATRRIQLDRPLPEVAADFPPVRPVLRAASVNPFRDRVELEFGLPLATAARVTIFDVGGRVVRTLIDGDTGAGTHVIEWDGADDRGRTAASGSYYARMEVPGYAPLVKRLVLVR